MKEMLDKAAARVGRSMLRMRSAVLLFLLGVLGVCLSGCPQPQPVYGAVVLYGPPYMMKTAAEKNAPAGQAQEPDPAAVDEAARDADEA